VLQSAAAAAVIRRMHAWPSAAGSACKTAAAAPHKLLIDIMWQPQLLKDNEFRCKANMT
jgi:hypothetical protein